MRESTFVVFDQPAQTLRRSATKLTELAQQAAQTVKTAAQQTPAFLLTQLRKGDFQIRLAGTSQLARQPIPDSAQRSAQGDCRSARQDSQRTENQSRQTVFERVLKFSAFGHGK